MNGVKTRFKENNLKAEKYTEEEAITLFEKLIDSAVKCKYYSIQEVLMNNRKLVPYRTFYYLLERFPVLQSFKKEMGSIIIAKVNKGALKKDLSAPMAIWRGKQLGEVDKTEQEVTNRNITVEV